MLKSMLPSNRSQPSLHLHTTNPLLIILIFVVAILYPVLGSAHQLALIGDSLSVGVSSVPNTKCVHCESGIGIDKLTKEVLLKTKDIPKDGTVLIIVGTNDYWRGYSKEAYRDKLQSLVLIVRARNPFGGIILVKPNPKLAKVKNGVQTFLGAYNDIQNVTVIEPIQSTTTDGVHYRDYKEYLQSILR
uniref:GDSL-like lipase n=1 Tax=Providencia phage vB_PstP_PS3 TaxID=2848038 RepID=A0A411AWB9_9CAUD|nr:GDSL-like lipase [Providencia phage vB_PstP_PS3]QAX92401.1 GDSL-like lipase [Providencia phage vB_PstP_PS3]